MHERFAVGGNLERERERERKIEIKIFACDIFSGEIRRRNEEEEEEERKRERGFLSSENN